MRLKETLTNNRNEYWQGKIKDAFGEVEQYLELYQKKEEYFSNYYNVKLVPVYDSEQDINICCIIDDELPQRPYNWPAIAYFHNETAVKRFLELFSEKLTAEEFCIISVMSDFSERLMEKDREIILLEAVIEL